MSTVQLWASASVRNRGERPPDRRLDIDGLDLLGLAAEPRQRHEIRDDDSHPFDCVRRRPDPGFSLGVVGLQIGGDQLDITLDDVDRVPEFVRDCVLEVVELRLLATDPLALAFEFGNVGQYDHPSDRTTGS